jgi:hypothetical protein
LDVETRLGLSLLELNMQHFPQNADRKDEIMMQVDTGGEGDDMRNITENE